LKRLTTAVFIAERFEGKGADRKPVPRTPEELKQLTHIVESALGIQANDTTRKDEVTLEEMPFNEQVGTEITQELDKQDKRQFWVDLGLKLVYPAIAVGFILMFWRLLKTTKVEDIPVGVPLGIGNGNGNGNAHYGRAGGPGVVSVEVLNQLIRENPANMTQAVRGWLARSKPGS
jgi:hypothetical protein